jgi:hypothetical protein
MNVIGHQMPFDNATFFLSRQLMKNWTQCFTNSSKECLATILRNENDMIFAIPLRMGQAVVSSRHIDFPLMMTIHQATQENDMLERSKLFKSHWSNQWLTFCYS